MVAGSVVLVILIGLVVAIMVMTIAGEKAPDVGVADKGSQQQTGGNADSGGVDQVQGQDPTGGDPTGGQTGTVTDDGGDTQQPDTPALSSIRITTLGGDDRTDVTMTAGDSVRLSYRTDPEDFEGTVSWKSSDESVATVSGGTITAVAAGNCTITVTMGDKSAECILRVRAAG